MNTTEIINDLNLLEAHANRSLEIAARLRKKLRPVSTGLSKNKGLNPEQQAKLLGKRRSHKIKTA